VEVVLLLVDSLGLVVPPLVPEVPVEPIEPVPPAEPLLLSLLLPVVVLAPEPLVPAVEPMLPLVPDGLAPDEELVEPVPPAVPAVPPPPCLLHAVSERAATTASTAVAVLVSVVFIRKLLEDCQVRERVARMWLRAVATALWSL
jgi:hypothetical protein